MVWQSTWKPSCQLCVKVLLRQSCTFKLLIFKNKNLPIFCAEQEKWRCPGCLVTFHENIHKVIHRFCGLLLHLYACFIPVAPVGAACRTSCFPSCPDARGTLEFRFDFFRVSGVFAIIEASGWPIWPLIIASIVAVALILERSLSLQRSRVVPSGLLNDVLTDLNQHGVSPRMIEQVAQHSPLGRVLAAGLRNVNSSREIMKESIEETGRAVAHDLERYLTTLGTIAAISPLLGLFGTIVGMIDIFASQGVTGTNAQQLSQGISIALNTTGLGLMIAIPATIFWRHFRALIDGFVIDMEQQAIKLVEVVHGERRA